MKKNKIIWILVGILVIGLLIFLITRKEKPLKPLDFPITNVVTNKTSMEFMTPILNAGLHELNVDSIYIMVIPMSSVMKNNGLNDDGFDLKGSLIGNKKQFIMYVSHLNRNDAFTVVAHELIHLEQFHSGRLVKKDSLNLVLWDGQVYDVKLIPYMERPWEKEAFKKDKNLEKKILKRLLD